MYSSFTLLPIFKIRSFLSQSSHSRFLPEYSFNIPTATKPSTEKSMAPLKQKSSSFNGKDKSKLFDIIDKLRELGIHEDISLPQLVVVGDQSSGKSSLLEALTRLPFPVAGTLCTRFATQILFRRTAPGEEEKITVTIIPSERGGEQRKAALKEFSHSFERLDADEFTQLMSDAGNAMGLPKIGELHATGSRFSDDVLKIELSGPSHRHFSVVDVPGLFQAATVYQTEEDGKMVESLVKRYVDDSRTIILAVASSLHETANQKVFRLAKAADPRGIRTLGVLTKPDALQKGDEKRIIDVALNNVTVLNHGWFVIRNRSTQDIEDGVTLDERNDNEREFFSKSPWKTLPRDRVGIEALEKFLRALLEEHVKKEFPNLLKELNALVEGAERELEILGPSRESPDEQRRILLKLAGHYQIISTNAILGNYREDFFGEDDDHKLRMHIANHNDRFHDAIVDKGHRMSFEDIYSSGASTTQEAIKNEKSIYCSIYKHYSHSRGAELPGMVNPVVVQNLFKWQSSSWEEHSNNHVDTVQHITNTFINGLLKHVCPDTELEARIKARLEPSIEEAYARADKELESILKSEREGVLLTLDDSYADKLQEARKQRIMLALKKVDISSSSSPQSPNPRSENEANMKRILEAVSFTNEIQSVNDIHDILRAYYHVARKRFIDNVAQQVIERHYLSLEEGGPARCFSPQWVGNLSEDDLEMIAGEDKIVSNRRAVLLDKLEKWKGAKKFAGGAW